MTRKGSRTVTGWRRRYLVRHSGEVILIRGHARGKRHNEVIEYLMLIDGRWTWEPRGLGIMVETDVELAALRLQGIPVAKEPRWQTYSS